MNTMRIFCQIAALWALLLTWQTGQAQPDQALLRELAEENKQSVEALALYPEDVRLSILEAAKEPVLLVRMQNLRAKTSAAFRTLIEDYPRDDQARFYDFSRYPGLPGALAAAEDARALAEAAAVLPENQRAEAIAFARGNRATLRKIGELFHTSNQAFETLIQPYPPATRQAFQALLDLPEVVDLLNEDLRLTVLAGDLYRENPAWVIQKMDSLHLATARAHAEETEAWKKALAEDPQARSELQEAAQTYSAETYGYDDVDYPDGPEVVVVDYAVFHPYPYWFGYPWWYVAPRWRPYPYWYDWGFYAYPDGWFVGGMPSYFFMYWYFDHPYFCYRFNYLSTRFVRHYYGHRRSGTTISVGVGAWRNRTRAIISDQWLSDPKQLPGRLKEYGRFEENRQKFNQQHPGREQSPETFLDDNTKKYPQLADSRKVAREEAETVRANDARKPGNWAPAKEPIQPAAPERAKVSPPPDKPAPPPTRPPRQEPKPQTPPANKPRNDAPLDKAQDYHRQKWEAPQKTKAPANQPERRPAESKPAPAKNPPAKPQKSRGG
jgi:hypothetical protein